MNDGNDLGVGRRAFAGMAALGLAAGLNSRALAQAVKPQGAPADAFTALRGKPIRIGSIIFPRLDQIDLTGPFSVLGRLTDSSYQVFATEAGPIRDHKGLLLTADRLLADAPEVDLLHVAGGPGQEGVMSNEILLNYIRRHVAAGKPLFSVCTGALICGAAGVLKGRRATTHWAAFDTLPYFGAIPVKDRVVVDGNIVTAAGITAGIDGALTVAALLRGDKAAQNIQLDIQYAPHPPFNAGEPETAPPDVVAAVKAKYQALTDQRLATARKVAAGLGVRR